MKLEEIWLNYNFSIPNEITEGWMIQILDYSFIFSIKFCLSRLILCYNRRVYIRESIEVCLYCKKDRRHLKMINSQGARRAFRRYLNKWTSKIDRLFMLSIHWGVNIRLSRYFQIFCLGYTGVEPAGSNTGFPDIRIRHGKAAWSFRGRIDGAIKIAEKTHRVNRIRIY